MYSLVRPKLCIPVHGEPVHLHEHVKLAKAYGIEEAIKVENGSLVLLNNEGESKIITKVESGYLAVDGNYLLPADSSVFRMRRRMRESGIVIATLAVDKKSNVLSSPVLSMPGLLDATDDAQLIDIIKSEVAESLSAQRANSKGSITNEQLENVVRSALRRSLKQEINKSPIIIVNIQRLNIK